MEPSVNKQLWLFTIIGALFTGVLMARLELGPAAASYDDGIPSILTNALLAFLSTIMLNIIPTLLAWVFSDVKSARKMLAYGCFLIMLGFSVMAWFNARAVPAFIQDMWFF